MAEFHHSDADTMRVGGKGYHVRVGPGDIAEYILTPGDPARIDMMTAYWDEAREVAFHRHYRVVTGTAAGVPISAVSHGIGGASLEPALNELVWAGAKTVIRVGTTGSIADELHAGHLVINSGAVRFDGTSGDYVWPEYPAFADYEVTMALVQACEELELPYAVGVAATMASFYAGQGRPAAGGYRSPQSEHIIDHLRRARVLNIEMECATLFTLGRLFGLRTGMIAAVVADRRRNVGDSSGIEGACRAATRAVQILAQWDKVKKGRGKRYVYPGLLQPFSDAP